MQTGDNNRFVRHVWEISPDIYINNFAHKHEHHLNHCNWVPYIKGAKQKMWIEPLEHVLWCNLFFLEILLLKGSRVQNRDFYFRHGISYSTIGNTFRTRVHRYRSVIDVSGSSVFLHEIDPEEGCCSLNSLRPTKIVQDLNPTQNFQVSDIKRIPFEHQPHYKSIFNVLYHTFAQHESHRETSFEFKSPGPSSWKGAQEWAKEMVNFSKDRALQKYTETKELELDINHLSYAFGIALGRFHPDGTGITDPKKNNMDAFSLPHGFLFLNGTLSPDSLKDSLGHNSCKRLHETWNHLSRKSLPGTIQTTSNKLQKKSTWIWIYEPTFQKHFFAFHLHLYKNVLSIGHYRQTKNILLFG